MHQNGLSGMYLGFEVCQIQWHLFQVSTISNSWKIKISDKNFTFCWFWLGKMHHNDLSGMYLGFEVCQIQWHLFQVSTISNSWKIKIWDKNFTFCWIWLGKMNQNGLSGTVFRVWDVPNPMALVSSLYNKQFLKNPKIITWFWLGKMHQNGLSGKYLGFEETHNISESTCEVSAKFLKNQNRHCHIFLAIWQWIKMAICRYLGFELCQIQWHRFQVSMISGFLKNQNFRQKFHILLILTEKNASKWPEWHIFRVWGVPNPMAQVSGLYNKPFLWNQNFRQKFYILLILTWKKCIKWLEWHMYLGFARHARIQWHRFQDSTISNSWKIKISGKNFTFCWFWLGKMHHNGLSGMYLGFEVCQIQWHLFQVSMISNSWKIKISGKNFTFCWFWLGKMHQNGLSGMHI